MDRHITLLGTLHVAYGLLGIILGLFLFWFFTGIGIFSGEPKALGVLGILGGALGGFIAFMSLPHVVAGYALLKHLSWSRVLGLIIGALGLLDIPLGTALGIYTLWVLMQDESARLLGSHAAIRS